MTPKELAIIAAKALDEKKGKEIAAIEVTEQTTLADFFVIATGTSNTQINALCGSVEKAMKEQAGEDPLRREGYRDGTWVLLDYGCVVVHVFSAEAREFYSLERLWHDGKPLDLSDVLTAASHSGQRVQTIEICPMAALRGHGAFDIPPSKDGRHPDSNRKLRNRWWLQPALFAKIGL